MLNKPYSHSAKFQAGYLLVIVAGALLGLGTLGMRLNAHYLPVAHETNSARGLNAAHQALLSYAVNYIDLYGVQGAGPGHFPCPDTDGLHTQFNAQTHRANSAFSKDGPNPPCVGRHVVTGKLPRHISVERGRYVFHTEPNQRFNYAVDAGFINNPVNRVVNAQSKGAIHYAHKDDIVAVVSLPSAHELPWLSLTRGELNHRLASSTLLRVITVEDFRVAMMRRVGHWYLQQLNMALNRMSLREGCAYRGGHAPTPERLCLQQKILLGTSCQFTALSLSMHWLLSDARQLLDAVRIGARALTEDECQSYQQALSVQMQIFQQVPMRRHWFVRNKWYEHIRLDISAQCHDASNASCMFSLLPIVAADKFITIQYSPNALQGAS